MMSDTVSEKLKGKSVRNPIPVSIKNTKKQQSRKERIFLNEYEENNN